MVEYSGDRAAVPQAHRGRRRCAAAAAAPEPIPGPRLPCGVCPLSGGVVRTRAAPRLAATLGVCTTVLKKVCRRHGIRRWPQRKLQSLNKLIDNLHNAMQNTDGAPPPRAHAAGRAVHRVVSAGAGRCASPASPARLSVSFPFAPRHRSCRGAPAPGVRNRQPADPQGHPDGADCALRRCAGALARGAARPATRPQRYAPSPPPLPQTARVRVRPPPQRPGGDRGPDPRTAPPLPPTPSSPQRAGTPPSPSPPSPPSPSPRPSPSPSQ